ncbi:MAG: FAD-dependent oxidoreductase [Candidatus Pacebacteria bacterium]|nr:FAD-dependent oxidoreductase [Candidatus Paceibacterota bacterium]
MKFVVIGANAAGMSAASRVKRRMPDCEVTVLEQTLEVSYGACGLPFYVAGLNNDLDLVRIRSVADFEKAGIQMRLGHTVERIDFAKKTVLGRDLSGNAFYAGYDRLLIASGASPRKLQVPGETLGNIFTLKTPQDAERLRAAVKRTRGSVVIVGGGAIGLELAEACILQKVRNLRVLEAADQLLPGFDAEFAAAAQGELANHNVCVNLGERVVGFTGGETVERVTTEHGEYEADVVIVSIGVTPNTAFAEGLEKLPNGAIATDPAMKTSEPDVFAAGDCAGVWHKLLQKPVYLPLGTYANKQGRLAGDSVCGKTVSYDRALGSAMLRCLGLEFAKTGLTEAEARAAGIDCKSVSVRAHSHPHYYPNACEIAVKLCYRESDRVLLGAQLMGERETAIRIDPIAVAIDRGMTTQELGFVDFGYAPPFAGVWDAIAVAANAAK